MSNQTRTQIAQLTPVDQFPTRKDPQKRYDEQVHTSMGQLHTMVDEINTILIPNANKISVEVAENAAISETGATEARESADNAKASETAAKASELEVKSNTMLAVSNAQSAVKASESAEKSAMLAIAAQENAEALVGVGIATVEKAGIVRPDGVTITVNEKGVISVGEIESPLKVVTIPELSGSLYYVAIGGETRFGAKSSAALNGAAIEAFIIKANGAQWEVEAVDNACEFSVTVPADVEVGLDWPVEVAARDNMGNLSVKASITPKTVVSAVSRPIVLVPKPGNNFGVENMQIVISQFLAIGSDDVQTAAQYRLVDDDGAILWDSGEKTDTASFTSFAFDLSQDVKLPKNVLVRARQKGETLGWSEWSESVPVTVTRDYVMALDGAGKVWFSQDGINYESPFETEPILPGYGAAAACEVNGLLLLCLFDKKSLQYKMATSRDGITWTFADCPISDSPIGFCVSDNAIVLYSGAHYAISSNGFSWSAESSFNLESYHACMKLYWCSQSGLYVLFSGNGGLPYTVQAGSALNALAYKEGGSSSGGIFGAHQFGDGSICFFIFNSNYFQKCSSADGNTWIRTNFNQSNGVGLMASYRTYWPCYALGSGDLIAISLVEIDANRSETGKYYLYVLENSAANDGSLIEVDADFCVSNVYYDPFAEKYILWHKKRANNWSQAHIYASGGESPAVEKTGVKNWPFVNLPSFAFWSEIAGKFLLGIDQEAVFALDSIMDHLSIANLNCPIPERDASSDRCIVIPQFVSGFETVWGVAGGNYFASFSTSNGKDIKVYSYAPDVYPYGVGYDMPTQQSRFYTQPVIVKAFGSYFYTGDNGQIYMSASPHSKGGLLAKQPANISANRLVFTGEKLLSFPNKTGTNGNNIEGLDNAGADWSRVGFTGTYCSRVASDGNGIVVMNTNGYGGTLVYSLDHGSKWQYAKDADNVNIDNVFLLGFAGDWCVALDAAGFWIARNPAEWQHVAKPENSFVLFGQGHEATQLGSPGMAADGRIIIPMGNFGVFLLDPQTHEIEMVNLLGCDPVSNLSIMSTYSTPQALPAPENNQE